MKKTMYGLIDTKDHRLLGLSVSSEGNAEFPDVEQYQLKLGGENVWLVDESWKAEYARTQSTEWSVSSYESPINAFTKKKSIKVAKYVIVIEEIDVNLPNVDELYDWRIAQALARNDPDAAKVLQSHKDSYHPLDKSTLEEYMKEHKS